MIAFITPSLSRSKHIIYHHTNLHTQNNNPNNSSQVLSSAS